MYSLVPSPLPKIVTVPSVGSTNPSWCLIGAGIVVSVVPVPGTLTIVYSSWEPAKFLYLWTIVYGVFVLGVKFAI